MSSVCSFPNCKNDATVKVTYEEVKNGLKEDPINLCDSDYNREDETGTKYYKVGIKDVEVLN